MRNSADDGSGTDGVFWFLFYRGGAFREALVILLMSMVNEKQPVSLRCAVLYCFQCFLFKNEVGQSRLIQTLLPSTVEREYGDHVLVLQGVADF